MRPPYQDLHVAVEQSNCCSTFVAYGTASLDRKSRLSSTGLGIAYTVRLDSKAISLAAADSRHVFVEGFCSVMENGKLFHKVAVASFVWSLLPPPHLPIRRHTGVQLQLNSTPLSQRCFGRRCHPAG